MFSLDCGPCGYISQVSTFMIVSWARSRGNATGAERGQGAAAAGSEKIISQPIQLKGTLENLPVLSILEAFAGFLH